MIWFYVGPMILCFVLVFILGFRDWYRGGNLEVEDALWIILLCLSPIVNFVFILFLIAAPLQNLDGKVLIKGRKRS